MTEEQIKCLLHDTESKYHKCWKILASLKQGPIEDITLFQPILSEALFDLSKGYRQIHQLRKSLISRKEHYLPQWFSRRLKLLAERQEAITNAYGIGQNLGDSFAWFFYQRNNEYLLKHAKHIRSDHMPPGIGGIGELEFVRNIKMIGKLMVLYHGITTILRLGDISLIDLKNFKVAAIGEIKTKQTEPGKLLISVILTSRDALPVGSEIKISKDKHIIDDYSGAMKERLRRQLKKITETVVARKTSAPDTHIGMEEIRHTKELEELLKAAKTNIFTYKQIGPGLLLSIYKHRKYSLSDLFISKSKIKFGQKLDQLENHALKILIKSSQHNSIYLGTLQYSHDGRPISLLGTIPIFWWPISSDVARKIIFQEVTVATIYNPAHIIAELESKGYSISYTKNQHHFHLKLTIDGKIIQVEGMRYFIELISNYLFDESQVIDIIERSIREIKNKGIRPHVRYVLQFNHVFRSLHKTENVGQG